MALNIQYDHGGCWGTATRREFTGMPSTASLLVLAGLAVATGFAVQAQGPQGLLMMVLAAVIWSPFSKTHPAELLLGKDYRKLLNPSHVEATANEHWAWATAEVTREFQIDSGEVRVRDPDGARVVKLAGAEISTLSDGVGVSTGQASVELRWDGAKADEIDALADALRRAATVDRGDIADVPAGLRALSQRE